MSKNNPPVGSLPGEVADDIPAMISEGEFMLPADVVRYHGLEKIRGLMSEAKMGLSCMEDEGLIIDVDAEGQPEEKHKKDHSVFESVIIEEAKPMVKTMNLQEGGMPDEITQLLEQELQGSGMPPPDEAPLPEEDSTMLEDPVAEETPDSPVLSAPIMQTFNGVTHILAYLNEKEVDALTNSGLGLKEDGTPKLSPEGITVFEDGDDSVAEQRERGENPDGDFVPPPDDDEDEKETLGPLMQQLADAFNEKQSFFKSAAASRIDRMRQGPGGYTNPRYEARSGGYVTPMALGGQMQDLFSGSGAARADEVLSGVKKKLNKGGSVLHLEGGGGAGEADPGNSTPDNTRSMTGGLQDVDNTNADPTAGLSDGSGRDGATDAINTAVKSLKDRFNLTKWSSADFLEAGLLGTIPGAGIVGTLVSMARNNPDINVVDEGAPDTSALGGNRGSKSTRRVGEDFYGPGNDPFGANWMFEPGDAFTPEEEKESYHDSLRFLTGFKDNFGENRFQNYVNADETGNLRKIADSTALQYDQGEFAKNVEFVDIPDQSILESQGSGGVSGSPFAIKIVDKDRNVKFYAPDMFSLAKNYASENPDVASNYSSINDYIGHYNEFGKNEGREFYNPEMFNFSNVGTLSEKGHQDDTAENQFNPYLNDVTDLFKSYTKGEFEYPTTAAYKGGDVKKMYNRPEEMSLADGGAVLHFARGGGAEVKKDTLMPNLSSLGDLPKDIAGKPPSSVGPALDDKFDMDPNQYGYQQGGGGASRPSYEKFKGDVFGTNLIDEFAKGKNFANPADAVTAYNKFNEDYFNSTPRLEGDDLESRQKRSTYFVDPSDPSAEFFTDRELNTTLGHFGIYDKADRLDVLTAYQNGDTRLLKTGLPLKNNQFITALDQLSNSRRIKDEGVTDFDIQAGPPDSSGNRAPGLSVEDFMGGVVGSHELAAKDDLWDRSYEDTDYLSQTGNRLAGIMRDPGYGDYHRDKFDYNLEDRPDSKKMGFLSPKMTADYNYGQRDEPGEGDDTS